jgi:ribosomal protein S18 acetylase RimI-like enzyme
MHIYQIEQVDDEMVAAFGRLLPQLSQKAKSISKEALEEIISSNNTLLIVADHGNNKTIATLTIVFYRTPVAIRARIEDVVVDRDSRGKGIGETLIQYAIEKARQRGCASVDLTSRPERMEASRLYQKIGFNSIKTNVFRYPL